MQVPEARGRVIPDIDSIKEDLPADWLPTTAICGRSMSTWTLTHHSSSFVPILIERKRKMSIPSTMKSIHEVEHTALLLGHLWVRETNSFRTRAVCNTSRRIMGFPISVGEGVDREWYRL